MSSDEGLRIEERGASDEFEGKQRNKENTIALLRQSWGYKPDLNVSLAGSSWPLIYVDRS
jgi:hypothetical protein